MKDFVRVAAAVPQVRPADVAGNLALSPISIEELFVFMVKEDR